MWGVRAGTGRSARQNDGDRSKESILDLDLFDVADFGSEDVLVESVRGNPDLMAVRVMDSFFQFNPKAMYDDPLRDVSYHRLLALLRDLPDHVLELELWLLDFNPDQFDRLFAARMRRSGIHRLCLYARANAEDAVHESVRRGVTKFLQRDAPQLRSLTLEHVRLHDNGLAELVTVVCSPLSHVACLNLMACSITCPILDSCMSSLSGYARLQRLNLSFNPLGDSGAQCLASFLVERYTSLQRLYLDGCGIAADGCASLASALRNNRSLVELSLNHNKIGNVGAQHMSHMLPGNAALQILRLQFSAIDAPGILQIVSALHHNHSLHVLDLLGGGTVTVDGSFGQEVNSLLTDNLTLESLFLDNDNPDLVSSHETTCQENQSLRLACQNVMGESPSSELLFESNGGAGAVDLSWLADLLGSSRELVKLTCLFVLLRSRPQSVFGCSSVRRSSETVAPDTHPSRSRRRPLGALFETLRGIRFRKKKQW